MPKRLGNIILHSPGLHPRQWIDLRQRRRSARQEIDGTIPGAISWEVSSLSGTKDGGEVSVIEWNVNGEMCEGTLYRGSI